MDKKVFKVYNTFDYKSQVHEYDIVKSENEKGYEVFTLFKSYDDHWLSHCKGEEVMSITDTGDGLILPKKMNNIDYSKACELYILIAFINKGGRMPLFQGVIEEQPINAISI